MWGLGSASMTRTFLPWRLNSRASSAMIVVLPTPPLPLIAIFMVVVPESVAFLRRMVTIQSVTYYKHDKGVKKDEYE